MTCPEGCVEINGNCRKRITLHLDCVAGAIEWVVHVPCVDLGTGSINICRDDECWCVKPIDGQPGHYEPCGNFDNTGLCVLHSSSSGFNLGTS